jgi:DNA-binding NarL/FixJ family response regulator
MSYLALMQASPGHEEARARVLVVVEDDFDMRLLVKVTLAADPRIDVAGEAASAREAIELARGLHPGLIILDHAIEGDMTGLEAAPLIRQSAPNAKILLFTAYDLAAEARAEPAIDGYLRKDEIHLLLPTVQRFLGLTPTG